MTPTWLKRAVSWIGYYLGLGESPADVEEQFADTFGQLTPVQMSAAMDLAEQAQENAEAIAQTDITTTLGEAIGTEGTPAEDVGVTGVVTLEGPGGATYSRTVQATFGWDTTVGEAMAELIDIAEAKYETEVVGFEWTSGALFPF